MIISRRSRKFVKNVRPAGRSFLLIVKNYTLFSPGVKISNKICNMEQADRILR